MSLITHTSELLQVKEVTKHKHKFVCKIFRLSSGELVFRADQISVDGSSAIQFEFIVKRATIEAALNKLDKLILKFLKK